jgi:hypothetical protein
MWEKAFDSFDPSSQRIARSKISNGAGFLEAFVFSRLLFFQILDSELAVKILAATNLKNGGAAVGHLASTLRALEHRRRFG